MNYKKPLETITSKEVYLKPFQEEASAPNESKQKRALDAALDIRKFEIDLYWKRAAYFWAFIALVATGYFAFLTADKKPENKNELLLFLSGLGFFLSLCWFCVNKASKYWQENWEKHVDLLEDEVMGPLYKTLHEYGEGKTSWWSPLQPYDYSISKINQLLSFAIVLVWFYLLCDNIANLLPFCLVCPAGKLVIFGAVLLSLILLLFIDCKASNKKRSSFDMLRNKIKD